MAAADFTSREIAGEAGKFVALSGTMATL